MRRPYTSRLLAAGLTVVLLNGSVSGHEGHENGPDIAPVSVRATPRGEAASELFELVAVSRGGELTIYLDRFSTNEPVPDAAIQVETPAGSIEARPSPDGSYTIAAPWSTHPGRYDLIFTVTKGGEADVLPLTLEVSPAVSETQARMSGLTGSGFAGAIKDRMGGYDPIIAAAVGGFFAGVLAMALARRRRRQAAAAFFIACAAALGISTAGAHEGEDHGAPPSAAATIARDTAQLLPDGGVFVPKSTQRILAIRTIVTEPDVHRRTVELPGRIIPDPSASGYVQTSVGGRLSAPAGGFPQLGTPVKKGDVLAYVTPPLQAIDVSDMRQRQGELDQQISIVERRLGRYEQLAPSGAIARIQLDETRLELDGLKERRASLDKVRREPEALVAPVDGVVAAGTAIAGQIAQTNGVVFHIIDPARLWVEALSYETLSGVQSATVRVGDKSVNLSYRGSGFADRNQSIPIHFAIESNVAGLRAGQFITVLAATDEEQKGLAVPRASLVRNIRGQELVYEHVSAERFEPRPVRVEPLDGERVFIAAGLTAGRRVVVQGAELLDQIR
jgi:hypothetical protein